MIDGLTSPAYDWHNPPTSDIVSEFDVVSENAMSTMADCNTDTGSCTGENVWPEATGTRTISVYIG